MAFPVPVSPIEAPTGFQTSPIAASAANKVVDKSVQFQHTPSKSTIQKAAAFGVTDACGVTSFIKGNISANINQLNDDCELVQGVLVGSLSLTVARIATDAEIENFVKILVDELKLKISEVEASL